LRVGRLQRTPGIPVDLGVAAEIAALLEALHRRRGCRAEVTVDCDLVAEAFDEEGLQVPNRRRVAGALVDNRRRL
jgi:hypothetical protein